MDPDISILVIDMSTRASTKQVKMNGENYYRRQATSAVTGTSTRASYACTIVGSSGAALPPLVCAAKLIKSLAVSCMHSGTAGVR